MLDHHHHHHHHHHHRVEVSVNIREVAAQRPLVGGFSIAQRVQASMSLVVGSKVRAGSKVARSFIPLNHPQKTRKMQEKGRKSHRNEHLRMLFPRLCVFVAETSLKSWLSMEVVVHAGCRGTVLAEFSDTRLTVVFETSETGTPSCFNVLPLLSWNLAVSFFSFSPKRWWKRWTFFWTLKWWMFYSRLITYNGDGF